MEPSPLFLLHFSFLHSYQSFLIMRWKPRGQQPTGFLIGSSLQADTHGDQAQQQNNADNANDNALEHHVPDHNHAHPQTQYQGTDGTKEDLACELPVDFELLADFWTLCSLLMQFISSCSLRNITLGFPKDNLGSRLDSGNGGIHPTASSLLSGTIKRCHRLITRNLALVAMILQAPINQGLQLVQLISRSAVT